MDAVEDRIARVVAAFQLGRATAESSTERIDIERALASADALFVSVAFEGAASGLAFRQLKNGAKEIQVPDWPAHAAQVHIGIGWALAEFGLGPMAHLSQFNGVMQGRVLDGFGYHHGLFRRRRCIQAMEIPDGIPDELLTAFDQGLGRAMWYISKGEWAALGAMTAPFGETRKQGLWRGIGVAASYVGGLSDQHWPSLIQWANPHQNQLKTGILLAAAGRTTAKTDLTEIEESMAAVGLEQQHVFTVIQLLNGAATYADVLKLTEASIGEKRLS